MRIEPVNDVARSLAHYAKGRKRVPFRVAREQAWEAHVRDKFNGKNPYVAALGAMKSTAPGSVAHKYERSIAFAKKHHHEMRQTAFPA